MSVRSGPLRAPVAEGLKRAAAVVLMGDDQRNLAPRLAERLPVLRAHLALGPEWQTLRGQKVVAFAGIGIARRRGRSGDVDAILDATIAALEPSEFAMPRARATALAEACRLVADGSLVLDAGSDRTPVRLVLVGAPELLTRLQEAPLREWPGGPAGWTHLQSPRAQAAAPAMAPAPELAHTPNGSAVPDTTTVPADSAVPEVDDALLPVLQIGRASCRERV